MGKFMMKCKGIGEVAAVMEVGEVGVRTRAKALAMSATTRKGGVMKRRSELQHVQLRRHRGVEIKPEKKTISPANSEISDCLSWSPGENSAPTSRCSSNGSSELLNESMRSAPDLKEFEFEFENENENDNSACADRRERRRETTPSSDWRTESDDLDSTAKPAMANSRRTVKTMPLEAEIDAFFSLAEKAQKKRFADKYNFDVEKDLPMEGRYEWTRLKQ